MNSKKQPRYMIVYECSACSQESGLTELDKPVCRFCNSTTTLSLISKEQLTPQVMQARLKKVTDNMMKNLEGAFNLLPDLDKNILGEGKDPEEEMLKLMARAQEFREKVHRLELRVKKPNVQ